MWNNEYVESYQNALESDNVRLEFQELKSKLLTEDVDINANLCVCVRVCVYSGLTSLSTIFQSYHDGVWLR